MFKRSLIHFGFIGGVAFVFDAITYFVVGFVFLLLLGQYVPAGQKAMGFVVGVITTYLYNSRITFAVPCRWRRFWRYLASQLLGMAVNLSVFLVLRRSMPVLPALISATLIAAAVNFLGAKRSLRPK